MFRSPSVISWPNSRFGSSWVSEALGEHDRREAPPRVRAWDCRELAPGPRGVETGLRYWGAMNPARKRTVRLVVALSVAVVLASALIYTSFSAASPALSPSQLLRQAQPGRSYLLTGTVVAHSVARDGAVLNFSVADRAGSATAVPVAYTGTVPDPFREGREVIVTVEKQGGQYVGERNSLITKCPSKYKEAPSSAKQSS
jgi:cytochrome c-type biogenesis protein CcmE